MTYKNVPQQVEYEGRIYSLVENKSKTKKKKSKAHRSYFANLSTENKFFLFIILLTIFSVLVIYKEFQDNRAGTGKEQTMKNTYHKIYSK